MKFFDTDSLTEVWSTITRNKFRSVATGFGVFWGLFMLIVLLAIGNRVTQGIMLQVDGMATNSVLIWSQRTSEPYKGYRKGRWWSFQNSDLAVMKQRSRLAEIITPIEQGRSTDKGVVRGIKSLTSNTFGVYPDAFRIQTLDLLRGRSINEVDIEEKRKVCLIGETVQATLFTPDENPIGQFIRVNGIYFQVVGVVSAKSQSGIFWNVEESLFIPFPVQQTLFGDGNSFYFMAMIPKQGVSGNDAEAEIKSVIREIKDISPTDTSPGGMNIEKTFQTFRMLFFGINFLMWMVGIGALMSGIIGISNIMLVTVRERMREIGVRRALGAKPSNILIQIMSESFVLTAIAGLGGLMLGLAASLVVEKVINFGPKQALATEPAVSFGLAMSAMVVLILSGIVAGLLPAWRALKIKAIDAIRDE